MSNRLNTFIHRLHGYADLECIVTDDGSWTYAQLLDEYEGWCSRLDGLGISPATVIGLRADYSLASVAALLALLSRHAVVCLIPRGVDSTSYVEDAHAAGLLEIGDDGEMHWQRRPVATDHPLLAQLRQNDEGGIVIFTSGSTGRPKAALQSIDRFLYKFDKPGRRFRTLAFLLFDHVAGLDTLFYTLSSGGAVVVTRNRRPRAICELIRKARVEVLPASPSFLRLMCLSADDAETDLSSLRIVTYGGEPMDPSTLGWLNDRFPGLQIKQKYGTTETGSPRSVSRSNDSLWLSFDRVGLETRIVNDVLYLRSEGTILGYLNAPSPVDDEGWYCTGDLVDVEHDIDGKQWIRFRGRGSDTINVGGENVSPAEVEQVIMELDFVENAVVRGAPHVIVGQVVTAQVSLHTETAPKDAEKRVRIHCRSRLLAYKVPIRIDVVEGKLTNARQKSMRGAIKRTAC